MILALAMTVAVVAGDDVSLRAAPERSAAQQATLWRGDWLELRGERKGWLKVYDHRHERPGWISREYVRVIELDAAHTDELRAVVDFLRDQSGTESLGIAYAGLYLRAAPASAIELDVLVGLGVMADRLARRGSEPGTPRGERALAAHVEVAESWGVHFVSVEDGDRTRLCYDGEAFRYALGMGAVGDDRARAALALSDDGCAPPALGLTGRQAVDEARLALVEPIDPTRVAGWLGNRLRIRRAQIGATLAWTRARRGDAAGAKQIAEAALAALLRVDKAELADEDAASFNAAALLVASSRWAAAPSPGRAGALTLVSTPGADGEVCPGVAVDGKPPASLTRRCTHGQVWESSFRAAPDGASAALAVQPLPGWLELWIFRKDAAGAWSIDVLPPATEGPDLGYVELAGWSPDGERMVIVREARTAGAIQRSFEIVRVATLAVELEARRWAGLGRARRWVSAAWRDHAIALR